MDDIKATNKRKTLIFGIDGGTWDILNPLLERGVMPCLNRLRESGAWGNLQSVVPVNSAAAWSSLVTGMAPEKHGIYDFFAWHSDRAKRTSVNATWLPRPTLFELMGKLGEVLALKVPMTYPPWPIPGVMVSGLPTPDDETAFTFPSDLAKRLNPLIEKDSAGRSWELEGDHRYLILSQLEAAQRSLENITDRLLKDNHPQTCFVVARDIDELQHFFWDSLTGKDEYGYLLRIEAYFNSIDRYLQRMVDWAGEEGRIVIMSDHGFGPVEGIWHLNDWLKNKGFLRLKSETGDKKQGKDLPLSIRLNFALKRRLLRLMQQFGMKGSKLEQSLIRIKMDGSKYVDLGEIDWYGTMAYAGNVGEELLPIFINLHGREPWGIVTPEIYDSVRDDLKKTLEENSNPMVLTVHRCEDIFAVDDPQKSSAPDLIVETINGAVQSDFCVNQDETFQRSRYRNGCHRRQGMFILAGADVKPQHADASLLDVPATILAWQGINPPAFYDGQILHQLIDSISTPEETAEIERIIGDKTCFSEDDEEGVRKKLESLGYM
ncbi:hypothetical protein CEE37_02265 [candidate division LCP-89 bacterium B3_LCP]|uniref:Phosphodiesterase n=1 Tax=candidate division LCP-89 bacterium B3_LCP TaxID=2012998 RepID=A0A532V5Q4_UNCL8|nr:MAG: hypothetical protein CEE37_02265 [candidate division LCP-89 bacterium B3_LCP]